VVRPTLRREKSMLRDGSGLVGGCDEVGRGALAGPVTVGVVVVDDRIGRVPKGLADSKLLSPQRREALVPAIKRWCRGFAVGHASPREIDQWGLTVALRLAGHRALVALGVRPDVVLLDGSYDWLSPRPEQTALWQVDLTQPPGSLTSSRVPLQWPDCDVPPIVTQIKADMACASVAAASVLAKTTRDAIMTGLASEHPHYAWDENKGYASDHHRAQLRMTGPSGYHRLSWRLGLDAADGDPPLSTDELDAQVLPSP
jgi:ribonuclease HII